MRYIKSNTGTVHRLQRFQRNAAGDRMAASWCGAICAEPQVLKIANGRRCQSCFRLEHAKMNPQDMQHAVILLSDYVRVYPNNSGRAIRFLERMEELGFSPSSSTGKAMS